MSGVVDEARAGARLPSPARARLIRVEARVTQRRLAEELGVDRVTVARWETGERIPRKELRVRYASLLAELEELV